MQEEYGTICIPVSKLSLFTYCSSVRNNFLRLVEMCVRSDERKNKEHILLDAQQKSRALMRVVWENEDESFLIFIN